MSRFFDVYGPFEIGRVDGQITRAKQSMWQDVAMNEPGLDSAIGCYMFTIQNGRKITPWYVGMTICGSGFYGEVFTDHKLGLYNPIAGRKGHRQMFLFPFMTGDQTAAGRFSRNRSAGKRTILWLEKTLMGFALQQNEGLLNLRDLTLPRSVTVRGVIGEQTRGRPFSEVIEVRRALFGTS